MTTHLASLIDRWPQCGRLLAVEAVADAGFSGASVYCVQSESASFALRRWPDDSLCTARIRELHRFLRFLQQSGIEFVAVPRADVSGATVFPFAGGRWQLEPWMPGSAIPHHPMPTQLANAMRALGRLHVAAARYEATESGWEWFYTRAAETSPAVNERLRMIREWNAERVRAVAAAAVRFREIAAGFPAHYARLAPVITRELESCVAVHVPIHPCLRDVHREHILISGDDVTGMIDASAARSENVASDLSRLLGSLLGNGPWDRALEAYSEVRPLTEDERRLATVLDRSGVLLSGLTWVQRAAEPGPEPPRTLERIHEIRQRLQALTLN